MDAAEPDATTIKAEETVVLPRPGFTPPTPAELAARFPNLEVLELLGHGGMGMVYKGRQPLLDRLVAVKIIRPDLQSDAAFQERFLREARTLAKLRHPFIVTVFDVCRAGELYGLVMEYVEGASLRQLLEEGSITQRDALDFVPQITEALQHAHEAGVVHRDIKPENVLVDARGRVRLVDFGLATLFGPGAPAHGPEERVAGTLRYMAPEQLTMPEAVDHRADIYSTGVVFYEMLAREAPRARPGAAVPEGGHGSPPRPHRPPRARARAGAPLPGGAPDASRHHGPGAHARVDDPHREAHPRPAGGGVRGRGPTRTGWPTGMPPPTTSARPSARSIRRSEGRIASACCLPGRTEPRFVSGQYCRVDAPRTLSFTWAWEPHKAGTAGDPGDRGIPSRGRRHRAGVDPRALPRRTGQGQPRPGLAGVPRSPGPQVRGLTTGRVTRDSEEPCAPRNPTGSGSAIGGCRQPPPQAGDSKRAGAVRGAAPLRLAVRARLGQRPPDALGVIVLGVDRGAGLLPPGLVQAPGVDAVEPQLIEEPDDDGLGAGIVARHRQGDPAGGAGGPAAFHQVLRIDVVERLDHGPAQLPLDPPALRQPDPRSRRCGRRAAAGNSCPCPRRPRPRAPRRTGRRAGPGCSSGGWSRSRRPGRAPRRGPRRPSRRSRRPGRRAIRARASWPRRPRAPGR